MRHIFITIEKCIHIHYCSPEPFSGHAVPAAALESSVTIYPPRTATHSKAVLSLCVEKNISLATVSLFLAEN